MNSMRRSILIPLIALLPAVVGWFKWSSDADQNRDPATAMVGLWTLTSPPATDVDRLWHFGRKGKGHTRTEHPDGSYTKTFRYQVDVEAALIHVTFDSGGPAQAMSYRLQGDALTLDVDAGSDTPVTLKRRPYADYNPSIYATYGTWSADGSDRSMFQLLAPNFVGKGTGWHHRGNDTEWKSEPVRYSRYGQFLYLTYPNRKEPSLVVLRRISTNAMYFRHDLDPDTQTCSYLHVRASFSRWLAGVPLPYRNRVKSSPTTTAKRERECRDHMHAMKSVLGLAE